MVYSPLNLKQENCFASQITILYRLAAEYTNLKLGFMDLLENK